MCFLGYGLTESSPVLCMPRIPPKNLATVGAPLSQTQAQVISVETNEALGPGETGELCFRGPQVHKWVTCFATRKLYPSSGKPC